jgi:hypothetical protein
MDEIADESDHALLISDDEETQNDDDDGDDTAPPNTKRQKKSKGKQEVEDTPHCDINFVMNTQYTLLASDTQKIWGTSKCVDPAPKVPRARMEEYNTGDYLLLKGNAIKLQHTGNNKCKTTFDPEEELILDSEWNRFNDPMTGQDLVDLGDHTFLIWWQNVKPPPIPKPKPATIAKKKTKGKK